MIGSRRGVIGGGSFTSVFCVVVILRRAMDVANDYSFIYPSVGDGIRKNGKYGTDEMEKIGGGGRGKS